MFTPCQLKWFSIESIKYQCCKLQPFWYFFSTSIHLIFHLSFHWIEFPLFCIVFQSIFHLMYDSYCMLYVPYWSVRKRMWLLLPPTAPYAYLSPLPFHCCTRLLPAQPQMWLLGFLSADIFIANLPISELGAAKYSIEVALSISKCSRTGWYHHRKFISIQIDAYFRQPVMRKFLLIQWFFFQNGSKYALNANERKHMCARNN